MGALGALLVASLFFGWFQSCPAGECRGGSVNSAWEAFAVADVVLCAAGLLAVGALVLTLVQRTPALPLALTTRGVFVALAAAVCAVVRLIAPGEGPEVERLLGAWVGAGTAVALLLAMLASVRDERTPAPTRSLEEQARAVRTLHLTSSGEKSPGRAGPGEAT